MLSAAGGLEDYAENATVGLLNYHTIKNGFYLGHTEFRDLAGPVDWQQLADLGVTTAFLNICMYPEKVVTMAQLFVVDSSTCHINAVLDNATVVSAVELAIY